MISDKLQESNLPEWLSSSNLEQMKNRNPRAGKLTSLSRYDLSLSTIIGKNDKDAAGHKLDA